MPHPSVARPRLRPLTLAIALALASPAAWPASYGLIGSGGDGGTGGFTGAGGGGGINSKIPALVDRSGDTPIRVFESGAILLYLAEKFGDFLPADPAARAECLSWLFWQMGSAPYVGGGFGHFYAYAPVKIEYAIDRFTMETKRQLDVLDRRLAEHEWPKVAAKLERLGSAARWMEYTTSSALSSP
jgi:hypothetical protein